LSNQEKVNEPLEDGAEPRSGASEPDRRAEHRYQTNDQVDIQFSAGAPVRLSGWVRDVSSIGLGLELSTAIGIGTPIRIAFPRRFVIFGEVRYCRPIEDGFRAGVSIEHMFRSSKLAEKHIHDDELSLYRAGKGLTAPQVISFREHLVTCEKCQARLKEPNAGASSARHRQIRKK
jgi:hypothetical protein